MKTAMQLLIEYIESVRGMQDPTSSIFFKAQSLLKKEKELMLDMYEEGESKRAIMWESSVDYFNHKYNQHDISNAGIN